MISWLVVQKMAQCGSDPKEGFRNIVRIGREGRIRKRLKVKKNKTKK